MLPLHIPLTQKAKEEGLLPYTSPPNGWGMFFFNTPAIHTIGMKFPIDVISLDEFFTILDIKTILPNTEIYSYPETAHILELAPDAASRLGLHLYSKIYPIF